VDTIGSGIVYYSIGNFVFDQRSPSGRKALMPIITFKRDTILHKVIDIEIKNNCPMCKN
jgi:poly-gamma-glutamate synthesis protein (capsule biosynthesis protein)